MKFPIYLDYNATTPVDPEALSAMLPFFSENFGNAASNHSFGWKAEEVIEHAREQIKNLINAENKNTIFFTSGATEANNLALKGIAKSYQKKGNHFITQRTEHESILETCHELEKSGFKITYLNVNSLGHINLEELENSITSKTILVSIMAANNEIGTVEPLHKIGKICQKKNVLFHSDGAQAVGKIPLDVQKDGIDLLSISSHKFYGPKGMGALYVSAKKPLIRIYPLIHGGGHERGLRSGTLAVPLIVGFGMACEIAQYQIQKDREHCLSLRENLWQNLQKEILGIHRNGDPQNSLPGTLNVSFEGIDSEGLLLNLKELALSSGSACASKDKEPSHVIMALGKSEALAHSAIRFCIGRMTTKEQIDYAIPLVIREVKRLSSLHNQSSSFSKERPSSHA